jgi:hypothetical protein
MSTIPEKYFRARAARRRRRGRRAHGAASPEFRARRAPRFANRVIPRD